MRSSLISPALLVLVIGFSSTLVAQSQGDDAHAKPMVRTITNSDLEPYRQKRLAADAADDRHRKEEGLPSREEIRREQQERDERLRVEALQYEAARAEADARRAEAEANAYRNAQQGGYQMGSGYDFQSYNGPYLPYGYLGNYGNFGGNLGRQRPFGFRDHEFSRFPQRRIYVAPRTTPMRGR